MKTFRILAPLHDVLGEKQDLADLLMIGFATIVGGAALLLAGPNVLESLPIWIWTIVAAFFGQYSGR